MWRIAVNITIPLVKFVINNCNIGFASAITVKAAL